MLYYLFIIIVLVVVAFGFWQWALVEYNFEVTYGKKETKGELTTVQTAKSPYIKFSNAGSKKYYTVIVDDPDSPAPKNADDGSWRHMVISDIAGYKLQEGIRNIEGVGKILTPYIGPMPPVHSGPHKYHVRLLEQPKVLMDPKIPPERRNWDIDSFIDDHKLIPVAQKRFVVERTS
jgi:phosphatidylethanolamine-binding protein